MEFIDKLILSIKYDIDKLERKLLIRKLTSRPKIEPKIEVELEAEVEPNVEVEPKVEPKVEVEPEVEVKQETPTQRPSIDVGRYAEYYIYPSDRTNNTSYFKAEPGFRPK